MIYNGENGLTDIAETVKQAVLDIGPYKRQFDFIAVTGMSGALIGSPVALRLRIPLVVVRKVGDRSHSWKSLINCNAAYGRYLILDDFIATGRTFRHIVTTLEWMRHCDGSVSGPEYAGSYLYENRQLSWSGDGGVAFDHLHDDAQWYVSVRYHDEEEVAA